MKACQFCAEEIQDAAIVCKHCGRDLGQPVVSPHATLAKPKKPMSATKIAAILVGLLGAFWVVGYFYTDHEEFAAWTQKRDAWHGRCDQFTGQPTSRAFPNAAQDQCTEDLAALMSEAKSHGWTAVK